MKVRFPLLLTVAQPETTCCNDVETDFPTCEPRDLFKATYHQGYSVEQDRLDRLAPVAAEKGSDEFALDCIMDGGAPVGPFLFGRDGDILLKRYGSKSVTLPAEIGSQPHLTADGTRVLSIYPRSDGGEELILTDLEDGHRKTILPVHGRSIIDFQVGCAGTSASLGVNSPVVVALGHNSVHPNEASEIVVVDLSTGAVRPLLSDNDWHMTEFALSPAGDAIAFVNQKDGQVYYQDLKSPARHQLSIPQLEDREDSWGDRQSPQFSPDGTRVLYSCVTIGQGYEGPQSAKIAASLYAAPVMGGALRQLLGEFDGVYVHSALPAGPAQADSSKGLSDITGAE